MPVAALAAVLALVAGLVVYSGAYAGALPTSDDREVAEPTLRRVHEAAARGPVVNPVLLSATAAEAGPAGYHLNASLRAADTTWTVGPTPPRDAERASRPVTVRFANGTTLPARLAVEVWR